MATLSMATSRVWESSSDPGVSESLAERANFWFNTSSLQLFQCTNPAAGLQTWGHIYYQGEALTVSTLTVTEGLIQNVTTPGAYPYTVLATDYFVSVDTSTARTINMIASPSTGQTIVLKDTVGSATANNITVSGNGNNIDGAASYTMNTNYESITLVYNGSEWSLI